MTCSQLLPWNKLKLLLLTRLLIIPVVDGFCPHFTRPLEITKESFLEGRLSSLTRCFEALSPISESTEKKPCFWRPKPRGSRWKERINIKDLKVGQKLAGSVVNELLEGKTGPKVYFECGVGRTDKKGEWNIVHGMLRLDRSKTSVARKRAARLKKKMK